LEGGKTLSFVKKKKGSAGTEIEKPHQGGKNDKRKKDQTKDSAGKEGDGSTDRLGGKESNSQWKKRDCRVVQKGGGKSNTGKRDRPKERIQRKKTTNVEKR